MHRGDLNLNRLDQEQQQFLSRVRQVMENYFAPDEERIGHAHAVTAHAVSLLQYIDADPVVTISATYLHFPLDCCVDTHN